MNRKLACGLKKIRRRQRILISLVNDAAHKATSLFNQSQNSVREAITGVKLSKYLRHRLLKRKLKDGSVI